MRSQRSCLRKILVIIAALVSFNSALLAGGTRTPSTITPYQRYFLLLAACRAGDETAVEIILEAGADPNGSKDYDTEAIGGRYGYEFTSPLSVASSGNQIAVMGQLLKHGATVDFMEGEGYTPLVLAIYSKKFEATKLLLKSGASTKNPYLIKTLDYCDDSRISELFALVESPTEPQLTQSGPLADNAFVSAIATALEGNNWKWMATQIAYPVEIKNGSATKTVSTPQEFLLSTENLRTEALNRELLAQCKRPLFTNWSGSMVGDGTIWFTACHARTYDRGPWTYRILAIGGFAFQTSNEITEDEETSKAKEDEVPAKNTQALDEQIRLAGLLVEIPQEVLIQQGLYRIQQGDSGVKVAKRFSLTVANLQAINPQVDWNRLYVGQLLRVKTMHPEKPAQ